MLKTETIIDFMEKLIREYEEQHLCISEDKFGAVPKAGKEWTESKNTLDKLYLIAQIVHYRELFLTDDKRNKLSIIVSVFWMKDGEIMKMLSDRYVRVYKYKGFDICSLKVAVPINGDEMGYVINSVKFSGQIFSNISDAIGAIGAIDKNN